MICMIYWRPGAHRSGFKCQVYNHSLNALPRVPYGRHWHVRRGDHDQMAQCLTLLLLNDDTMGILTVALDETDFGIESSIAAATRRCKLQV